MLKRSLAWLGSLMVALLALLLYRLLSKGSFRMRYRVMMLLAGAVYRVWRQGQRKLKHNLSLISPTLAGEELESAAREVVRTIVRDWAALLGSEHTPVSELANQVDVSGGEKLLRYVHHRGGRLVADKVLGAAVHMGSFGAVINALDLFQVPVYAPAERLKPEFLLRLMIRLRSARGFVKLEPIDRGKTFEKMVQRMRCGWAIVVMVDILSKKEDRGVVCRIGRAKGRFQTGAVRLALLEGARLFPVFVLWTGERYRFIVEDEFELTVTGDAQRDIEANTRRLIEERVAPWIERYPGQWMQALWANLEPAGDISGPDGSKSATDYRPALTLPRKGR